MAYAVRIEADSRGPSGCRLTTFVVTYPRLIHAELLTHRAFSRNSASSRAIPTGKLLAAIETDPVMPVYWGRNQPGMQAAEEISDRERRLAQLIWLQARDGAVAAAQGLAIYGVHKQIANRITEPWMWITVIVSATEWGNFFALRTGEEAQPEIREVARRMAVAYYDATPEEIPAGCWHLPFLQPGERETVPVPELKKLCTARCARVSYLTHDGKRDPAEDLRLHDQLRQAGHWSAFEHCAAAMQYPVPVANFLGWAQYRWDFADQCRSFAPTPEQLAEWRAGF